MPGCATSWAEKALFAIQLDISPLCDAPPCSCGASLLLPPDRAVLLLVVSLHSRDGGFGGLPAMRTAHALAEPLLILWMRGGLLLQR